MQQCFLKGEPRPRKGRKRRQIYIYTENKITYSTLY